MLKKLITVAGLAGTLGVAAPAFADWYQPAPAPVYGMPVHHTGWYGDGDRDDWRRNEWRRHEAWERYRRWHRDEWLHHHHRYYQNW
ncbi:MAG TPA: hypothetical protein VHB97_24490 [Polyangia bacterium]|nr:hypothetical protein [Polyangia bacterium]